MDDDEVMEIRTSELDELLDETRRQERARAVRIVVEELAGETGELCGMICGEIDEGT